MLVESVPGLGEPGEVVRVAPGYARNFLVPRKLAVPVTEANRRAVEKKKALAETERAAKREEARVLAAKIDEVTVKIPVKVGAEDKLFGSVTALDIAGALEAQGIKLEKHQVELAEPLKALGPARVPLRLHPDVRTELKVLIVKE
jgi:large subunit ribosomal protein L9